MNKKILVIIILVILFFSAILGISNIKKIEEKSNLKQDDIAYQKISNYQDGIMLAKKDGKYLIITTENKVIEKLKKEVEDIKILYDGYYSYKLNNKTYLNRNGQIIKTLENINTEFELYKDSNEGAKFVSLNSKWLKDDLYYEEYKDQNIIYISKTGKILYNKTSKVDFLNVNGNYEYLVADNQKLVSLNNLKTSFNRKNVNILADSLNNEHLVINNTKTQKYGVINLEGKITIPAVYEDISLYSNNYIVAKKDGKYGLINYEKEKLAFVYDSLRVYNNQIILVKDGMLGIMDLNFNVIFDFKLKINNIEIYESKDSLIINNYDNEKSKILIINKNNEIKEFEKNNVKYIHDKNEVIKKEYLIEQSIDDKTVLLNIYNSVGESIAVYETITTEKINSVTYKLVNETHMLLKITNDQNCDLYNAIIDLNTGKVILENNEIKNYIEKQKLNENYYFYGENSNTLIITNKNNENIKEISGKDIIYLTEDYFAVKNIDNNYYIHQINLEKQAT